MLFATFGAVWTICILCITFVSIYLYNLHRQSIEQQYSEQPHLDESTYAWDVRRLWMLYALGISVCYLGTARLASTLSILLLRKLNQSPVPLLFPEQWLNLSAIFAVIAMMIGLFNRGEHLEPGFPAIDQNENSLLTDIRSQPRPLILPEDSTTYLEPVKLPVAVNALDNQPVPEDDAWRILRGGLVPSLIAAMGVMVLGAIAWLTFIAATEIFVSAEAPAAAPQTNAPAIEASVSNGLVAASDVVDAIALQPSERAELTLGRSMLTATSATKDAVAADNAPSITDITAVGNDQTSSLQQAETVVYTSTIPISLVTTVDPPTEAPAAAELNSPDSVTVVSAPATSAPQQPNILVPNSYRVNARLSPAVDSAVVYELPSGTTAQIEQMLPDGQWALVYLPDGRKAWVATWVVDVIDPARQAN